MLRSLIVSAAAVLALGASVAPAAASPVLAACTNTTVCKGPTGSPVVHGKSPSGNNLRGCAFWGLGVNGGLSFLEGPAAEIGVPIGWIATSLACIDGLAGPNQ